MASLQQDLGQAALVMTAFALGVATLMLAAAYGLRHWMRRRSGRLAAFAHQARPVMGWVFIAVGAALFLGLHHAIEAAALRILPPWLIDLSVSL
jgi:cytochrome c biogenesis protein CcdA